MITAGVNWRSWKVGVYLNTEPLTLFADTGPYWIEAVRGEPSSLSLPCNWTIWRITIARLSLDLRLDLHLNYWAIGYAAADGRDNGVCLGPLNLQIKIDKFYKEREFVDAWVQVHT